jgi:hypothetical protein
VKYIFAFPLAIVLQFILRGALGLTFWPAVIIGSVITMAFLLALPDSESTK